MKNILLLAIDIIDQFNCVRGLVKNYFTACAPKCYNDTIVLMYGNNMSITIVCYTRQYIMLYYWSTVADSHAPYCIDIDIYTYKAAISILSAREHAETTRLLS